MQLASIRSALIGLAFVGALGGAAGGASAQYYRYDDGDAYGYGPIYGRGYGYREFYPDIPRPPRRIARVTAGDYGLAAVDRTMRTQASTIVDGRRADGTRLRLIFDRDSGALLDRIVLPGPGRRTQPPRLARIDPRDDERPAPRIAPRPPERPAALRPPAQASAPATAAPPSPAAPARPATPETPLETPSQRPPLSASAPAVPTPAAPAPVSPATGAARPPLVNPQDVRGADASERKPPLAQAEPPAIRVAPVQLPPVQLEDSSTATPRSETPAVPVAPLD